MCVHVAFYTVLLPEYHPIHRYIQVHHLLTMPFVESAYNHIPCMMMMISTLDNA